MVQNEIMHPHDESQPYVIFVDEEEEVIKLILKNHDGIQGFKMELGVAVDFQSDLVQCMSDLIGLKRKK